MDEQEEYPDTSAQLGIPDDWNNEVDPDADESQTDALVQQTDNAATEEDGPQEEVEQSVTEEQTVAEEDPDHFEPEPEAEAT